MRKIVFYFLIFTFAVSCKREDDSEKVFPIEPYIEFRNIEFKDIADPSRADTLKVEFYLRDGDSDLGVDPVERNPPYNWKDYFLNSTGKKYLLLGDYNSDNFRSVLIEKVPDLITYKDRKTTGLDTLPEFALPYNCTNWEVLSKNQKIIDTLYFRVNPNSFNIFVDFYTQTNADWKLFDFNSILRYPVCMEYIGFNGKFPQIVGSKTLEGPFMIKMTSQKEGVMTYNMTSAGFKFIFSGKKVKLKVRIQDRALHKSNEIETSEIQF